MGVGGATWDTAGTLTLGSGNTFDAADASEDLPPSLDDVGWWAFTPAVSSLVGIAITDSSIASLRLFRGATYADREFVDEHDFVDDVTIYFAHAGVTYHLVVGTDDGEVGPAAYQVTYTSAPLAATPWIDTLKVRDDNLLIVSPGELINQNASAEFRFRQSWYDDVFGTILRIAPVRKGAWGADQVLAGAPVADSIPCVWEHAWRGNGVGGEGGWTGICSAMGTGLAERHLDDFNVSWVEDAEIGGGVLVSDAVVSTIIHRAEGLWFGVAQDNMSERGTFPFPDPVTDGAPEDAELEWEGPLKVTKIELTGDADERPGEGTTDALDPLVYQLRRAAAPGFQGGDGTFFDIWTTWRMGDPNEWDTTKSDFSFEWTDGDPDWHELDFAVEGDTGWEGFSDLAADEGPDETPIIGLARGLANDAPEVDESGVASNVRQGYTAIRYTFESPRYRWVYPRTAPLTVPPRRIFQRSDGKTHGAARVGKGNTRQSGSRTLGAIL